jgi:hypothetical protein
MRAYRFILGNELEKRRKAMSSNDQRDKMRIDQNTKRGERDASQRESDALTQDRELRERDGQPGIARTTGQSDGDRPYTRENIQPEDAGLAGGGQKERPVEGKQTDPADEDAEEVHGPEGVTKPKGRATPAGATKGRNAPASGKSRR